MDTGGTLGEQLKKNIPGYIRSIYEKRYGRARA